MKNGVLQFFYRLSRWSNIIAGLGMFYVFAISLADIIMNKFFKDPINWAFDSISLMAVVAIVFAIADVQEKHGHIEIEFLENRFGRTFRRINAVFINFLGMALWVIVAWRSFVYGYDILRSGEVSMSVGMPIYPFIWFQGLCAILVVLVLLAQTIQHFRTGAA